MISDTTLTTIMDAGVVPVEEGQEHLMMVVVAGLQLPIGNPNTGEPLAAPSHVFRVPLDRALAEGLRDSLSENLDKLPERQKPSSILLAQSLRDVDQVANMDRNFREGR
jgi:hypothetical protein